MRLERAARLLAAAVLAATGLGLGAVAAPPDARAARPDLTFVTAATYEIHPDEGRIAVTVEIVATNHLKDTTTRRFFFEQGYLAVLPGAENFAITSPEASPAVAVTDRTPTGVLLRIRFGERLAAGQSLPMTLTFDLVDPGGAPDRALRISPSLISFQAWAFATDETPGSSVEVRVPEGYTVTLGRGPLLGPSSAGAWQIYTSGVLDAPLAFVADLVADRPADFVEGTRSTTVAGETVLLKLRAWPDDPAWRARVANLFLRGLPVLATEIGAPWPFEEPLTIQETLVRGSGGYAGVFDPAEGLVQVSYTASPGVVLHEAAHGWFNGRLVADRWIAEAFATYYAELAAASLEVPIASPDLTAIPPERAFPLNEWEPTGQATVDEDAYGYAASLAFARELATLVGVETLRDVWAAIAAGEPAYQPGGPEGGEAAGLAAASPPETGAGPADWRALLDAVQAKADPALGPEIEALWRRWVLRPEDDAPLAARAEARAAYAELLAAAATWRLPAQVRDALRAWQFDAAQGLMADAHGVLRQRAAVEAAAAAAGLTPPPTLREAFENDGRLAVAGAEAATQLAAIAAIEDATAARVVEPSLVDWIGLIGVDPEARLATARSAFEGGDLDTAVDEAVGARQTWEAVPGVARGRIISALLLLAAIALFAGMVLQRRRHRRVSGQAVQVHRDR